MRNLWILILLISLTIIACSRAADEKSKQEEVTPNGPIDVIKKGSLVDFRSPTIGEAFDAYKYLTDKEWGATVLKSGHVTVDFTGWFRASELNNDDKTNGVKKKGLEVKFVIEPNGAYYVFMISRLELMSDGNVRKFEYPDINSILAKIYTNERIEI